MDGIPHPDMLRQLEAQGTHLGMSAEALAQLTRENARQCFGF